MRFQLEQRAVAQLARSFCRPAVFVLGLGLCLCHPPIGHAGAHEDGASVFHQQIRPMLEEFCFDCHGDGAKKGNVAFDELTTDTATLDNHDLWLKALKNLRAGLMPPPRKPQPTPEQKLQIERWIKAAVFRADPQNPDPGRVTVRRLNRVEYRNTVHDLMGVEFEADKEFPPDDAGFGFDNIGDVLTLPPMLLEKYFAAAKTIVQKAVPAVPAIPPEEVLEGRTFHPSPESGEPGRNRSGGGPGSLSLSYYAPGVVSRTFNAEHAGKYQLLLDFTANERHVENQSDHNKCRLIFKSDGRELFQHEFGREGGKAFHYEFDQEWPAGDHELALEVEPLTPDEKQVRSLSLRIDSVTIRGPLDPKFFVRPKKYAVFFSKPVPESASERQAYAREILEQFVPKAYRRPVDRGTIDRLVALAQSIYQAPGKTFEAGIGQAMVAVLASPRFLFREEAAETPPGTRSGGLRLTEGEAATTPAFPLVDEYALASRLSYFLWSSMPDAELFDLAGKHELRKRLGAQVQRMLADRKAEALVKNFVGQWLQVRDIENVQIDARQVLQREAPADPDQERRRQRSRELRVKEEASTITPEEKKELDELRATFGRRFNRPPRAELTGELRKAMRLETEKTFEYILHEDRSLVELLDSNYTFLNERLAAHYGLTNLNVTGDQMRLVKLPPDSGRGGVITEGAVLAVTSNPTRTSPVKRGLFILDNLLGTPPAPPPPDIPPLEDAAKAMKGRTLSLRETLALHREQALCSSCHNRMDPLGLALENFNAMGMWRQQERGQPIDATGKLLSGESFTNIIELKHILATRHAVDFYRTVTEKLLTYALGRGLEYYDVATVDSIVERLKAAEGHPSALLTGIIESAPFQKTRALPATEESKPIQSATPQAHPKNRS
jgi:hypothetical protein